MIKTRQDVFTPPPPPRVGAMVKLALVIFLFVAYGGQCFAYNLYVDSEAGTEGAIGSFDHPYKFIQSAINHSFNDTIAINQDHPSVQIIVRERDNGEVAVYSENLVFNYSNAMNEPHLVQNITIRSNANNYNLCQIVATDPTISAIEVIGSNEGVLSIKGFKILASNASVYSRGILLKVTSNNQSESFQKLLVDNCHFSNNFYSIKCEPNYIDTLSIQSSTIDIDYADGTGIEASGGQGYNYGRFFICNNQFAADTLNSVAVCVGKKFREVKFQNNTLERSQFVSFDEYRQDIFIDGNFFVDSNVTIRALTDAVLSNNSFISTSLPSNPSDAICLINHNRWQNSNITIFQNMFWKFSNPISLDDDNGSADQMLRVSASIVQNSFIDCEKVATIYRSPYSNYANNRITQYQNNLYRGLSEYPFIIMNLNGQQVTLNEENRFPVSYSHFSTAISDTCLASLDTLSLSFGTPFIIDDSVNHSYTVTWDNNTHSPLIMNGYGSSGMGTPSRYDRLDIGAVQYDDLVHEYINYTFPPNSERNGLKWMSFPTLDRIWNPTTNEPDVANTFFAPIKYQDILESIKWKVQDGDEQLFRYFNGNWIGDLSHYLIPQQGYKIQMAQGLQTPVSIPVPGIIPDVSQYPLTIIALPAAKNDPYNQYNENWLGYFHTETANAEDAFASVIDSLWYIQTQDWTMVREKVQPGSPWIYVLQKGKKPTLSYGDMVIVKCFSNDLFTWNTGADNQIPIEKELPIHYVYEEKADYVPFYVELDANDLPSEVALYVDDICKGATVVCDSLVEIPGYVLDGTDPNAEVEILAYYENKAAVNRIPAYKVWNPESGAYDKQPLKLRSKNHYYKLKLEKNGDEVPFIAEPAISIYPNPFNPSTTIKFCLAEPADIKLEIYNQRGQLVKCLTQGKADSGISSIIWNGTDRHNRKVASGLYYSKLSYNGKSVLKKMILMK